MRQTVFVPVMITDDGFFKAAAPGGAVIAFGTFDDNVRVFDRLMQIFDFRPVFDHIFLLCGKA